MWIKTSQTGTSGLDSSSKNSKILSNFYTVGASSPKTNRLWRRLMDIDWMKGKKVFMYVYLALQKLSHMFFQGHRLNWTIVLLNVIHGPMVDSSGTCINPQPTVLLEWFADTTNYLLFPTLITHHSSVQDCTGLNGVSPKHLSPYLRVWPYLKIASLQM